MAATGPIGAAERDRLLSDVRLPVAIAVSGGADSTAMMHLVARWARARGRAAAVSAVPAGISPVVVLTVDHGLRTESADEAAWVGREAERLGLDHEILRWTGPKPRTGIMEAARAARYALICERIGSEKLPEPRQVLLAHHLDDQAETVLMRLARGSGVDGLSGMRAAERRIWLRLTHPVEERTITILRPLLGLPKTRLKATLQAAGAGWLEDPSNADVRYERVRLRTATRERAELGLMPDKLALAAGRLATARRALDAAQHELARAAVEINAGVWASVDKELLLTSPEEVALRLLRAVIAAFGGQSDIPGRLQVENLLQRLRSMETAGLTLGGAVIAPARKLGTAWQKAVLAIYREPGRRPLPSAVLRPGWGMYWDRRFYLSLAPGGEPVRVEPLGQAGFARLKRDYDHLGRMGIPSAAAAALPAIRAGERLLTVPGLSAAEPSLRGPLCDDDTPMVAASFALQHVRAIFGADSG